MGSRSRSSRKCRRGLTLPEVVVSTLLVGVMMVAALRSVGAVFRTRLVAQQRQQGEAFAHQLMAEILQARYEDPDESPGGFSLDSGEMGDGSRALYDDVDDYDGWAASPPESRDGTPLPDAERWTRKVNVDRVVGPTPETPWFTDTGLKRIEVKVADPTGEEFLLKALRSRWGLLEFEPPVGTVYVTGLSGELQVGTESSPALGATAIVNHAEDE